MRILLAIILILSMISNLYSANSKSRTENLKIEKKVEKRNSVEEDDDIVEIDADDIDDDDSIKNDIRKSTSTDNIEYLYNWPNPVDGQSMTTNFKYKITSKSVIDGEIRIYALTGKLLKVDKVPVSSGIHSEELNLLVNDEVIPNGVYLYTLDLLDASGNLTDRVMNKLMIIK